MTYTNTQPLAEDLVMVVLSPDGAKWIYFNIDHKTLKDIGHDKWMEKLQYINDTCWYN